MIIETTELTKQYNEKTAVNSINLSVEEGQVYGFLGPNGAGKSTCIKMLTGLVHPTSGSGTVLSYPLGHVNARNKMGYLPELFRYQEWMTGSDLLNFHSRLYHLKPDKSRNEIVLTKVGLLGQEKYKVGSYSKGMQQRLGLACALLPEPKLLFLDEPTSALDPLGRKEVRDIILSLKKDGTTIFLNSHLLSEVEAVSDSITIINKGKIVKSGSMKEMLTNKLKLKLVCSDISDEVFEQMKLKFDPTLRRPTDMSNLVIELSNKDEIPSLASLLVSNHIDLYELTPCYETLEHLFLKLTREDAS